MIQFSLRQMRNFFQRISLPLVFAMIGLEAIYLDYGTLKRGEFAYLPKAGPKHMFSAMQTPFMFWGVVIGIFVVGGLFLAAAIYVFFHSRVARPVKTVSSHPGVRIFWLIVNVGFIPLAFSAGYADMAHENLRGTNPDQFFCLALIISVPLFVLGVFWYSSSRCDFFRFPSWTRNPFNWWYDPLQALFITTVASLGWAIGAQVRVSGSGNVGFWTVAGLWCIFVSLVIGQALGFWIFRQRIQSG